MDNANLIFSEKEDKALIYFSAYNAEVLGIYQNIN